MNTFKDIDYDSIRDEIRNMVLFREKRYLTDVLWTVDTCPEEATMFDKVNNAFRPLTDNEWNEVHHKDCNTAYLIVPLTRFREVTEVIPIGKEITAKNVIAKIHEFYHTPLTEQQINDIRNFTDDTLGYNEDLLKSAATGNIVKYVDLRGAAVFFEGIQRVAGNVYKLDFGS